MTYAPNRDFLIEVARGAVAGYSIVDVVGRHSNLTSSLKDLWINDAAFNWQTSAQSVEIVSTDADDVTSSGTGARTVAVTGLNSSHVLISEQLALTGTTPATCVNTYRFIQSVIATTVGSSGVNEGTITAQVAGGGAILAVMPAGEGITSQSHYHVPASSNVFILGWQIALVGATTGIVDAHLELRSSDSTSWQRLRSLHVTSAMPTSALDRGSIHGLASVQQSHIRVQAVSDTSGVGLISMMRLVKVV